jgi:hypothetical protein
MSSAREDASVWMRRYIITGAPGAEKTAILQELKVRGYAVVGEAATDVIACGAGPGTRPRPLKRCGLAPDAAGPRTPRLISARRRDAGCPGWKP